MARLPLSARSFFRDPVGYVHDRAGEDGVVHLSAGRGRYALVRDPEAIWQVLVSDGESFVPGKWKRRARRFLGHTLNTLDGPAHRRRRQLVQASLARRRVGGFVPALAGRALAAQRGWEDGAHIRLRGELDPLALTMAGDVLLSTDLAPDARALAGDLRAVMTGIPRLTPPIIGNRAARALARVERAVDGLIADRGAGAPHDDLLGALLSGGLPEETVRGELIAFLLAVVDEPPSALEATWFLLGGHPDAEERLHAELDAVVGDRAPRLSDFRELSYLDAVIRETLRLFPPARHIDRCPVQDVQLDGQRVRGGTNVLVSPLVTHREAELHERPDAFWPERWLSDEGAPRQRGSYLPFGAGVHACVGEPLARAIMTVTLASVGRRWRLRLPAEAPLPVPRSPGLTVILERR